VKSADGWTLHGESRRGRPHGWPLRWSVHAGWGTLVLEPPSSASAVAVRRPCHGRVHFRRMPMAIERDVLDGIARTYVGAMTSIRGRRVRRLLLREFLRFDHVLPATTADGKSALLALATTGTVAVCQTDGRGPTATLAEWARLDAATVTTAYDLLKDSLPIVSWTLWHPGFDRVCGAITISAAGLSAADRCRTADALRGLGARPSSQGTIPV
jgi:hypothetical protein